MTMATTIFRAKSLITPWLTEAIFNPSPYCLDRSRLFLFSVMGSVNSLLPDGISNSRLGSVIAFAGRAVSPAAATAAASWVSVTRTAPWVHSTYNNTYNPTTKTFWMHYGYNGTSDAGRNRQIYEKWVRL